ncbi:epimerase [Halarcobacter ebronensis]|uniref:Epimerase n=1 Tax=Halarcobacter ebronensis TaxID=1462615 RepID=A0A4Q0YER4_9BACT|nr:epimerase [Halarcobacter ebronensis]
MNKNSILITGSNGFVGSYFISKYKNKYDIKTFSFRKDSFDTLKLDDIDVIFHLSALVHQMGGASYDEYVRINVTQTLQLAKKAKDLGVKHFIFMSTVKVYGEETNTLYNEDTICEPEDDYGITKLMAENELIKLEDENFKISIIRTPIVYGYGVKANIKNLVKLVTKVSVLPFANIKNRRSLVYVGNLCHLVDEVISQNKNGIFLASDDEPISTSKLIQLISKALNKRVFLIKIPFFEFLLKLLKPNFHKRLYGSLEIDNTITKKRLSLKNPYETDEGIKFIIEGEK